MQNKTFTSEKESLQFYEERYSNGYMEDWDPEKKKRVIQLIRELNLPSKGRALDFGCGNGVLTQVLKQALPEWDVYGCDVSEVAIKNASRNLPQLSFFFHDGNGKFSDHFDFIFTHHVFEHVFDVAKSWSEIAQYGNDNSVVVHILPCGNRNSFEYNYCLLFKNGIDKAKGNRFFFEDPGHLRRMTTEEMEQYAKENSYHLFKSYYAHQYYGALNWIANSGDSFIDEFTNTAKAKDEASKRKILGIRKKILFLNKAGLYREQSVKQKLKLAVRKFSFKELAATFSLLNARYVSGYYKRMTYLEWQYSRRKKNGSEMFLFFRKGK